MSSKSMDGATTAAAAFSRRTRPRGCGRSMLSWPRRRRRSCCRPHQPGGRERSFAAGAFCRQHVLERLGEEPGRSRGRRHCCGWLASCRSIGLTLSLIDVLQAADDDVLLLRVRCLMDSLVEVDELYSSTYRVPSSNTPHARAHAEIELVRAM